MASNDRSELLGRGCWRLSFKLPILRLRATSFQTQLQRPCSCFMLACRFFIFL